MYANYSNYLCILITDRGLHIPQVAEKQDFCKRNFVNRTAVGL